MRFETLVSIVALVSLSGCITRYAVAPDVPKAALTLSTNLNGVRVQAYDDDKCTKSPYGNRLAYFFLGAGDPHSGVEKEIPAGKEFVFTFAMSLGVAPITSTTSCIVTMGFVPKANERYKSSFQGNGEKCIASLVRAVSTDAGERFVAEESARIIRPVCINNLTD